MIRNKLLVMAVLVVTFFQATRSDAYCVAPRAPNLYAFNRFTAGGTKNEDPLPIYLVTSGASSVLDDAAKTHSHGMGLTQSEIEATLKSVARAYSDGPARLRIYYAGTRTSSSPPVEGWLIDCPDILGVSPNTTSSNVSSGVIGAVTHMEAKNAGVFEYTSDPRVSTDPAYVFSLRSHLLHEFYHALGGGAAPHPQHVGEPCPSNYLKNETGWCSNGSDPSCIGRHFQVVDDPIEYPTADDMLAMITRFGTRTRLITGRNSSTGFVGSWSSGITFVNNLYTSTPVAVSAGTTRYQDHGGSVLAYTDVNGLLYISRDTGSGYGSDERVGGALAIDKRTVFRPGVDVNNGTIAVTYMGMEDADLADFSPEPYTCSRSTGGTTWTCNVENNGVGLSESPVLGAGYSALGDDYIVNFTSDTGDKKLEIASLDRSTGNFVQTEQFSTGPIRNPAKPVCETQLIGTGASDCYGMAAWGSTTYRPRINRFHMSTHDAVLDATTTKITGGAFGLSDLAIGDGDAFLASRADNQGTSTLYRFVHYNGSITDVDTWSTDYSPLAVGTMRTWTGGITPSVSSEFRIFWGQ